MMLGLILGGAVSAIVVTFVLCACRVAAQADRDAETGVRRFEDRS